ncbi:MAG: hypothetical protein L6R41_006510 [Letrouitia leprolyta]|nr:MAG: hypothetical protein L6R41_006510 [Letrouitia leprolyta]
MESMEAANLFAVKDLVAVVTGGGSGIGLMISKALAANGASKVYIVGRRKEVLEAAAKESSKGNIIPLVGDVTSKDSLKSIASQIEKEVGYINVLIANSGIGGPQISTITPQTSLEDYQAAMWSMPQEEYDRTFSVNVTAAHYTLIAFLHLLHKGNEKNNVQQKSQFIVTSSIGGFNRNVPGGYPYGQSKAAVTHLVKQMATQMVPYGIRANAIAPGLYPSEMSAPIIGTGVTTKDRIPAERVGSEEDMAGCILYLTSRAGAYVNGMVVVTDGGRLSIMPSTY